MRPYERGPARRASWRVPFTGHRTMLEIQRERLRKADLSAYDLMTMAPLDILEADLRVSGADGKRQPSEADPAHR